jgi:hypothetical protein
MCAVGGVASWSRCTHARTTLLSLSLTPQPASRSPSHTPPSRVCSCGVLITASESKMSAARGDAGQQDPSRLQATSSKSLQLTSFKQSKLEGSARRLKLSCRRCQALRDDDTQSAWAAAQDVRHPPCASMRLHAPACASMRLHEPAHTLHACTRPWHRTAPSRRSRAAKCVGVPKQSRRTMHVYSNLPQALGMCVQGDLMTNRRRSPGTP